LAIGLLRRKRGERRVDKGRNATTGTGNKTRFSLCEANRVSTERNVEPTENGKARNDFDAQKRFSILTLEATFFKGARPFSRRFPGFRRRVERSKR
jgi:hypothetical protein